MAWAKVILENDGMSLPFLVVVTDPEAQLITDLRTAGWGDLNDPSDEIAGQVRMSLSQDLRIEANGAVVLSDAVNPVSPPEWFDHVDAMAGRCVVVVVPPSLVRHPGTDLEGFQADLADVIAEQPGAGAAAILPVTH